MDRRWIDRIESLLARFPAPYALVLKSRGEHNNEKLAFLRYVRRNHVVFDIGANEGSYTLFFSRLVGRKGYVHAFEPMPQTFARLSTRLTSHRLFNVQAHQLALSDHTGQATIYQPGEDDGQASLRRHKGHGSWAGDPPVIEEQTQTMTIDDFVLHHGLSALDFVKCDAEGAELPILHGGRRVIERYRPILYVESYAAWSRDFDYEPADLVRFVRDLGYVSAFAVHSGGATSQPLGTIAAEAESQSVNFLFLPSP